MHVSVSMRVKVIGESHAFHAFGPDFVVSKRYVCRVNTFVRRTQCSRRAMHIAARDHRDPVADQPVIAREYVCWNVHASDVTKMRLAVHIRPGDADENCSRHNEVETECRTRDDEIGLVRP